MPLSRLSDALVAGGCIRPTTLLAGLRHGAVSPTRFPVALLLTASGLMVEPFAWLQTLWFQRRIQACACPDNPVVVIGHWRSGTTYLHQLLACDPTLATARNSLTMAPQVALLLKPWIRSALKAWMTQQRPIDAVPWRPDDPQEDELGLARLTMDTNMAGMAFPLAYPWFFRRNVLGLSRAFERQWLHFTKLSWLHDGQDKTGLLIKNSAHSARVELLLRHFPKARFVLLRRDPQAAIRSLVQVNSGWALWWDSSPCLMLSPR